ncbi:MAG: TetR family transcriptional regulator [Acidimicrobiia bacterium]|nr:TetR family transcriptional regulator [Acidimicrobiia bacterium]MDH5520450.1 TetR family transcriptional regulator [Acidimicrobiia bacterium]
MTESTIRRGLVDAAEHRFALDGIAQASLRAVMREANADPGAIHYHFGGREALAIAVLERVLVPLNAKRLVLLQDAVTSAADGVPSLNALVDALIRPDVEVATELNGRGSGRARLIGAIYLDPASFVKAEVEKHFAPVAQRFMPHLIDTVSAVPGPILAWRVRWFVFGVVGALMADDEAPFEIDQGELIDRLVSTACAALAAPSPQEGSAWK